MCTMFDHNLALTVLCVQYSLDSGSEPEPPYVNPETGRRNLRKPRNPST